MATSGLIEGTLRDGRRLLTCRDTDCEYRLTSGPHHTVDCATWRLEDREPIVHTGDFMRLPCGCPIDSGCDSRHVAAR